VKQSLNKKKKDMLKEYKLAIADSKNKAFRKFINIEKPWGRPYKVLVKKQERLEGIPAIVDENDQKFDSEDEAAEYILRTKFQKSEEEEIDIEPQELGNNSNAEEENVVITKEEIDKITKKLDNRKAPGIDGTNNKGLKILHKKHPVILT